MENDMAIYKNDFLQEVYEYLEIFNQAFVDLECGEDTALDEIFRAVHTIKGMAGFLGYKSLEHLCHSMEEVLSSMKNGEIETSSELIDVMLATVDRINIIVEKIEAEDNDDVPVDDLLEIYKSFTKIEAEDNDDIPVDACFKPENYNYLLNIVLSEDCAMKDLKATLIIESLKEVCEIENIEPDECEMENDFEGCFKIFVRGDTEKIEQVMDRISEIEYYEVIPKEGNGLVEAISDAVSENKETIETSETQEAQAAIDANKRNGSNFRQVFTHFFQDKIGKLMRIFAGSTYAVTLRGDNEQTAGKDTSIEASREYTEETVFNELKTNAEDCAVLEIEPQTVAIQGITDNLTHTSEESECHNFPEESLGDKPAESRKQEDIDDLVQASVDAKAKGPETKDCTTSKEGYSKAYTGTTKKDTIRIQISNLDNIMNLVGELVINKGCLLQISHEYDIPELEEAAGNLDKSITSLQDEVMRLRMVRVERVFSKFPRMVRDLSRNLGKNIDFEIVGQDTELDRTILDEIGDPLVHLIRNSVDHGIEYPEERVKTGKSETGHVTLSARQEKSNVVIEIEDDGKGIDLEMVKRKVLEKGLASESELDRMEDDEIKMFIFAPGFSTKEGATEISGRGVGMDVVKATVEKLGGKVRIYSIQKKKTIVRIDLPPTLAIIKSLIVKAGEEIYAIPISNVVEALNVDSENYKQIRDTPLLYVRNKLVPVVRLRELFRIEDERVEKEVGIIVEKENEEVGLIVDSIIDQQEIVIKPLGSVLSKVKGFIGVTILGDGRVIPILDVSILIRGDMDG